MQCAAFALCCANGDKPDLVRRVADAKGDLMIEKPPAAVSDDLPAIIRQVEEAGITCVQSFPQRLIPSNRTVKQILDAGELGPIGMVRKRHGHGFALARLALDMPWIVDPERAGGGALLDEGVHEMDLLRHYFGEPESVVAEVGGVHTDLPVEDTGVMLFRFPGGVIVELASGWAWRAGGPSTEIYGSEGTLLQFFTDSASNAAPDPSGPSVHDGPLLT
ncbi:MAG: Gfo/Idh/MocA family oxidoreductase [Trueperaceae bacterium]|nr:Gfo/Idh/MocA family oxidoreductase [Trueperaceae bacterium]